MTKIKLRTFYCERDRYKFKGEYEICPLCKMPAATKSKMGNVRVTIDGVNFQSKWEAECYGERLVWEKFGLIRNLRRQVRYELSIVDLDGNPAKVADYIADAVYEDKDGNLVCEDQKGAKSTREFLLKKKLMKFLHGIEVVEVRRPVSKRGIR